MGFVIENASADPKSCVINNIKNLTQVVELPTESNAIIRVLVHNTRGFLSDKTKREDVFPLCLGPRVLVYPVYFDISDLVVLEKSLVSFINIQNHPQPDIFDADQDVSDDDGELDEDSDDDDNEGDVDNCSSDDDNDDEMEINTHDDVIDKFSSDSETELTDGGKMFAELGSGKEEEDDDDDDDDDDIIGASDDTALAVVDIE